LAGWQAAYAFFENYLNREKFQMRVLVIAAAAALAAGALTLRPQKAGARSNRRIQGLCVTPSYVDASCCKVPSSCNVHSDCAAPPLVTRK